MGGRRQDGQRRASIDGVSNDRGCERREWRDDDRRHIQGKSHDSQIPTSTNAACCSASRPCPSTLKSVPESPAASHAPRRTLRTPRKRTAPTPTSHPNIPPAEWTSSRQNMTSTWLPTRWLK